MTQRWTPSPRRLLAGLALAALLAGCAAAPAPPTATSAPPPAATAPPASATLAPLPTATGVPTAPSAAPSPTARTASPTPAPAPAAPAVTAPTTRPSFSAEAAFQHVEALAVGIGVRATGTEGETRAATYLDDYLTRLGYTVARQEFPINAFHDDGATLRVDGFDGALQPTTLRFASGGEVSAPLVLVPGTGTAADIARVDVKGRIALIERGGLTFQEKVRNAKAAGAAAVLVYNNAAGALTGTLGAPADLPAAGLTRDEGQRLRALIEQRGSATAVLDVKAHVSRTPSQNVIAARAGLPPNLPVIVIGGHFDSVPAGPGANDNASGTAVALELARVLAGERRAEIRIVGFGAEEIGLIGSRHYVESLSPAERKRILGMVNLDMLAVGQELQIGGTDDLATRAIAIARDLGVTSVSRLGSGSDRFGASDHASFVAAGIPSLFLNRPDDPRYHTAQDQAAHVPLEALRVAGVISLGVIDSLLTR
ncbi:MAG: M20/M25/M40 family metallo-hydrolase [Chloroflexi bacterium]|nr:M20/M25/M40 family metallo-hydrolase [Chloroflexota bacterium]